MGELIKYILEKRGVEDVRTLLNAGVDVNYADDNGSALHHSTAYREDPKAHADIVDLLIQYGADPNAQDSCSYTTLMKFVCRNCDANSINILLNNGADVNPVNISGSAVLHYIGTHNNIDRISILKAVLEKGADVNIKDMYGETPLVKFVRNHCHIDFIRMLLDYGADVNLTDNEENCILHVCSSSTNPHRGRASTSVDLTVLELLIRSGANVNIANGQRQTPLMQFTLEGCDPRCSTLLLENGADVNLVDAEGNTVLHLYPLKQDNMSCKVFEGLLRTHRDINLKNEQGETPLYKFVHKVFSDFYYIQALLAAGADTTYTYSAGNTILHCSSILIKASSTGCHKRNSADPDTVRALIENGADINAINHLKMTPTIKFVKELSASRIDCVKLLLAKGADVNAIDYKSNTALHYYANNKENMDEDVFNRLLEKQCDINAVNEKGETPLLRFTRRCADYDYITKLLDAGADATCADDSGNTVLHFRPLRTFDKARNAKVDVPGFSIDPDIIESLIFHGANVNARNDEDVTPVMRFVRDSCHSHWMNILLKNKADFNVADSYGNTPLHLFPLNKKNMNLDVFEKLISRQSDINAKDAEGRTPLMIFVRERCDLGYIKKLLTFGADVKCADNDGNGALHSPGNKAVSNTAYFKERANDPEVFHTLIENGADLDAQNRLYKTPLLYFLSTGPFSDFPTVEMLFMNGADIGTKNQLAITSIYAFCKQVLTSGAQYLNSLNTLFKYLELWDDTIVQFHFQFIYPTNDLKDGKIRALLGSFKAEKNKMMNTLLKENLTVFTFLMEIDRRKMAMYINDCNLDLEALKNQFPHYSAMLEYKVNVGNRWCNIMSNVAEKIPFWSSRTVDGKEVKLGLDSWDRILKSLENRDLLNLKLIVCNQ